jgi:hypothetical protein
VIVKKEGKYAGLVNEHASEENYWLERLEVQKEQNYVELKFDFDVVNAVEHVKDWTVFG